MDGGQQNDTGNQYEGRTPSDPMTEDAGAGRKTRATATVRRYRVPDPAA